MTDWLASSPKFQSHQRGTKQIPNSNVQVTETKSPFTQHHMVQGSSFFLKGEILNFL